MRTDLLKKLFVYGLIPVFLFSFKSSTSECNPTELKNEAKEILKPFKYDSAKLTKVLFKKDPQKLEVEVPLFIGEKYKFLFNTKGMPKNIIVSIYTKSKESKKREMLFSNETLGDNEKIFSFEPEKSTRKLYINYEIPASESTAPENGCLLFLLGYK